MVLKMVEICAYVVMNAVLEGRVSNAGVLPLHLRRWIFEFFRIRQSLNKSNLARLLVQPGFLDGFTAINLHVTEDTVCSIALRSTRDASGGCSLTSLEAIFGANRRLAETITDLTLGVSGNDCVCCDREHARPRTETVVKLLGFCRNLKRLRLIADLYANIACLAELERCSTTVDENDISFPALEHLSLIRYDAFWTDGPFPHRLFESLQSLELCPVLCRLNIYREMLTCCRDTLTSLVVSNLSNGNDDGAVSPVPILMPKLSALSVETTALSRLNFEDIQAHCPSLTTASLTSNVEEISDVELAALANLSGRLRLHIRHYGGLSSIAGTTAVVGPSVVGLCVKSTPFAGLDCRSILSNCPNLMSLEIAEINVHSAPHLEHLFNDTERAARLTDLHLSGDFVSTTLQSLFANCNNLQCLHLVEYERLTDINDYLRLWIGNGARPIRINLCGFNDLHPEVVYSLLKASGRNLKEVTLRIRIIDENVADMCRNVLVNYCPYLDYCQIACRVPLEPTKNMTLLRARRAVLVFNRPVFKASDNADL